MSQVLLLDNSFQPITFITLKKALKLIVKERVEVIKSTDVELHKGIYYPKVLRLIAALKNFFKRTIKWSKGNVFLRDNYTCQYCGIHIPKGQCTLDHIIPVSKGGKDRWENSACSCKKCNQDKGNNFNHEIGYVLRKEPRTPTLLDLISIKFKDLDMNEIWG
jgi:5-methylcytosine-specific restriction endonuclease McrA